ncbi:hypothetical protein G9A89_003804, partial [Geosiphon pyriformis]
VKHLNGCPHDNNKIWQMAFTKIEDISKEEIRKIKNNPPEPIKLDWISNSNIVFDAMNSEQFHKHYQNLALTKEEQE